MPDIFDQIAESVTSGAPSSMGATDSMPTGGDIFDQIAQSVSSPISGDPYGTGGIGPAATASDISQIPDVTAYANANANGFQKGASGYLNAMAGFGDLVDLAGQAGNYLTPQFVKDIDKSVLGTDEAPSVGGGIRDLLDKVTGVPGSTQIGKGSYAYKLGEYLPAVLNPEMLTSGLLSKAGATAAAKTVGSDVLLGTGGYVGREAGEVVGAPVTGEVIGTGLAGAAPGVLKYLFGGVGTSIYDSLLGIDKTKGKLGGFVDAEGNAVAKAVPGGSQVSTLDPHIETLQNDFYPKIKVTDSAKDVSNKLSIFKQDAGATIGDVIDTAADAEKKLMGGSAPWQNAKYLSETAPDFTPAQEFVDSIAKGDKGLAESLQGKLDDIAESWNSSNQGVSDLKELQSKYGLINKKAFSPTSSAESTLIDLKNKIYGSLAESVKEKVDILGKSIGNDSLGDIFKKANQQYAAAATFEPKAFQATNGITVGGAIKEALNPLNKKGIIGPLAKGVAPVQIAKAADSLSALMGAISPGKGLMGALGIAGLDTNVEEPTKSEPGKNSLLTSFLGIPEADASEYNPGKQDLNALIGKVTGKMEEINPKMVEEAPEFATKVDKIAQDLGADPEHLLAVMNFETGGKLTSDVKNMAGSGATGLIQFMPATAKELTGAKTKSAAIKILEKMTPVEQLDYVKKYLQPFKGKLKTLEDMYMAVLYPKAVGKDSEYALFKEGTKAYWQNKGLDIDKDGVITKFEAASKVRNYEA